MDVQNFLLLQNYTKQTKKLEAIQKRQASVLSLLQKEYADLKGLYRKPKLSSHEKFENLKSLRDQYTLKFEVKPKNVDERVKSGWLPYSPKKLPHVHELSERRSKMLSAGNSFSKNNRKSIQEQSIRKVASATSPLQMKREMRERANDLGNFYSSILIRKASRRKKKIESTLRCDAQISHYKPSPDELINETKKHSTCQTEASDDNKLHHCASDAIEEIFEASEEVNKKFSEVNREEVIDYDAIDDAIMREVKKASIECSQSEIDDDRNNGLQIVIEDVEKDSAVILNEVGCSSNLTNTIVPKVDIDDNRDDDGVVEGSFYTASYCPSHHSNHGAVDKNHLDYCNTYINESENSDFMTDTEDEITVLNESPINKLRSAISSLFTKQLIDDVTQPVNSQELNAHKNSADDANSRGSADNQNSESSCQQVCKLSSHSNASVKVHATSTFISSLQIFARSMEMRRKRTEGNENLNSLSKVSNDSFDESKASSEIMKKIMDLDS